MTAPNQAELDKLLERVATGGMPETARWIREEFEKLTNGIREHRTAWNAEMCADLQADPMDIHRKLWSLLEQAGEGEAEQS